MLCKRTGAISLLNAGFQQLVTLLKLMDYHWHKIKAFLWLVESSAEFSEQILYLSVQCRNREWNVCVWSMWEPFLFPFCHWTLWTPGMALRHLQCLTLILCLLSPAQESSLLQGHRGGFTFPCPEGGLGKPKVSLPCTVKPTKPMEILWATLSALCSHRQNYKHIRVSFCSSEGKLPHVYLLLISSSFLLAVCWRADSKRKTWFPSCYTLVELSPKCKTKIRMQGHS